MSNKNNNNDNDNSNDVYAIKAKIVYLLILIFIIDVVIYNACNVTYRVHARYELSIKPLDNNVIDTNVINHGDTIKKRFK